MRKDERNLQFSDNATDDKADTAWQGILVKSKQQGID